MAEKCHLEKCAEIEKNKTRIIAPGGGRKPEISSKEGICLCLIYLRQKPIFEILGLLFDISKTKANDTFNYWVEILREILLASQIEEVEKDSQKYQDLRKILGEYELIVDSTEQALLEACGLPKPETILFWQEKNAHSKKSVYCAAKGRRYC